MRTVKQIKNLKNKTVLLRGDLDVPMKKSKVADNFRLKRMLPTILYLSKKGADIIIIGHLGRPGGTNVKRLSMQPVAKELMRLLNINKKEIKKLRNWKFPPEADRLLAKEIGEFNGYAITENIYLLENLRFYEGEEKNDLKLAKQLAGLGDVYVNECFSASHRKHASFVGIPKYLPSFAGLNLSKEVVALSKAMNNPKRPAVAILGGAKLETKLSLIKELGDNFNYIMVGGKLGLEMEKKLKNQEIKKLVDNIIIPVDYAGAGRFDIGKRTIKLYTDILRKAKTIVWNGPMGKYEDKKYIKGTAAIAEAVVKSKAYSVVGGGDIIAALDDIKILEKMNFVSTGGGAMLEFLERGALVGLKTLGFYK